MSDQAVAVRDDVEVLSLCTISDDCEAPVDQHDPNCPIEHQLRQEFGF